MEHRIEKVFLHTLPVEKRSTKIKQVLGSLRVPRTCLVKMVLSFIFKQTEEGNK